MRRQRSSAAGLIQPSSVRALIIGMIGLHQARQPFRSSIQSGRIYDRGAQDHVYGIIGSFSSVRKYLFFARGLDLSQIHRAVVGDLAVVRLRAAPVSGAGVIARNSACPFRTCPQKRRRIVREAKYPRSTISHLHGTLRKHPNQISSTSRGGAMRSLSRSRPIRRLPRWAHLSDAHISMFGRHPRAIRFSY
jgi:hypothetical protein